jgi:hypothetical protein
MPTRITTATRIAALVTLVTALLAATILGAGTALAAGKPGYPDKVTWNGAVWQVKSSTSAVGPGPNVFSKANVSVDSSGLHLRIQKDSSSRWTTAEVIGPTSYGYGTYTFTVASRIDQLDANVVLGLFTWSDRAPYAHRELDVEVAKWGDPADTSNAQFVVQPYDKAGHLVRFATGSTVRTVQQFEWRAGRVTFTSRDAATGTLIASSTYTGSDVPKPGDERVRLNLWLFNGAAPTNGLPTEVVVESFAFAP